MKNTFVQSGKKLFQHELISGSSFLFIGSMVGNVFAFLLNLFLARHLTTAAYGVYASLLSLMTLAVLLPSSFSTTLVQFATQYFSQNEMDKAKTLYRQSTLFLFILGSIICIACIIFAPSIGAFFHVSNTMYIVAVGFLILVGYVSTVNAAFMQSFLAFGFLSVSTAVGLGLRLVGGIGLVLMGWGVLGALVAVGIGILTPFLLYFFRLGRVLGAYQKKHIPLGEIIGYGLPSAITVIALSSFVSTDILLAKHFLSDTQAGLYAGTSLVGKVILYFTGSIPAVMFPLLIHRKSKGHGVHNTFYLGLLLVGIPSFLLTAFYALFPHLIIGIFLGGRQYAGASVAIGLMALFISLYSILGVIVNFFLSQKQTKIVWPVALLALLQMLGISFFHQTIMQIITVSVVVTSILIGLLVLYYYYHHKVLKTYTQVSPALQNLSIEY